VDKDEEEQARAAGRPMGPAAVVYTATRDGRKRHFTVVGGTPEEVAGVEEGFGAMLGEKHPTKGFRHNGRWLRHGRYSLYWSGFEPDYRPRTADQLAAARARREQKAVEREAEGSLFADLIREEGYVPKPPGGRSPG
jgi:hypothetical protein